MRLFHLALPALAVPFLLALSAQSRSMDVALHKRAAPSSSSRPFHRSPSAPALSGAGPSRSGNHAHTGVNDKYLILARHGSTFANEQKLVQGHTETEKTYLNADGHRDAQKLADNIQKSGYKVHEIVSCHQKRTCETAAPIAKAYPEASHHTDTRLMGVGMGTAEGEPYQQYGLSRQRTDDWRKIVHGAEPKRTYEARVNGVFEDVISKPAHQFHGRQTKGVNGRHLHDQVATGETHTTAVIGHDWPTRNFLDKVGKKPGVTRFPDADPDSSHGSAGVSMVKVKNIKGMPRRPNGNVDLDCASGDHFEIHHVANKADQSIEPQTNPKLRLRLN